MARVVLKNVSKKFPGVTAVKSVSFEIEDKEFMVLVGPSGCGKSTTLRMVAGLEEITEGEIYIEDRLVNDIPPKDRDIAMVFQNYALYPHMDVYGNMAFGLKLRKFPKDEIERRVKEAAEILGIESLLKRKPKELSGGQRQRVAVGRAIVRKPKVFLFDEPLSNLDAKLRITMRAELSKLHTRLQSTMIYVTHDQVEALTMGDRIVVMKDGIIQQIADPITLYRNPVNKFVGGFIGMPPMNFIPGRLIQEDSKIYFDAVDFKLRLVPTMAQALVGIVGKDVILGVRPEEIHDKLFSETAPAETTIQATIEVVEPMGREAYLYLSTGKHSFVAKVDAHDKAGVSQSVQMLIDMSRVHFFDADTEVTLV